MANIFENPRAPFIGRSPVPGPQTPPGQSFGNFYFGGTPRMNTMQRPRANSGGQAPMPTGYEYGAGISGGAGYAKIFPLPNRILPEDSGGFPRVSDRRGEKLFTLHKRGACSRPKRREGLLGRIPHET